MSFQSGLSHTPILQLDHHTLEDIPESIPESIPKNIMDIPVDIPEDTPVDIKIQLTMSTGMCSHVLIYFAYFPSKLSNFSTIGQFMDEIITFNNCQPVS